MNFFKDIILKKQILGNENLISDKNSFHIAFGIDANFTIGTGVLIYSILQHNKANMVFHIFTDSIYYDDISRFTKLINNNNIAIIIYFVNPKNFSNLPTEYTWTQAIYYRILACECLPTSISKILYLDSDILCLKSLINLFNYQFNDNIAMVTGGIQTKNRYIKSLNYNFKNTFYFNSGVMLINIPAWKKHNISSKFIDLLSTHNDFKYFDQDVLNILLYNKVLKIPHKYNDVCPLMDINSNINTDTILLHYAGSCKPWHQWGKGHSLTKLWLNYKLKSPWKDVPILQPTTYRQAKNMARIHKKNKQYLSALYWYLRYSLWKIKTKLKI